MSTRRTLGPFGGSFRLRGALEAHRPAEPRPVRSPPAFSLLGWRVIGMDRRVVGTVEALLIGASVSRSRYLAVSLDPTWHATAAPPYRVIAPLECARLALGRNEIMLRGLAADECVKHLAYGGTAISPDDEAAIWIACALAAIARPASAARPMGPISTQIFPI